MALVIILKTRLTIFTGWSAIKVYEQLNQIIYEPRNMDHFVGAAAIKPTMHSNTFCFIFTPIGVNITKSTWDSGKSKPLINEVVMNNNNLCIFIYLSITTYIYTHTVVNSLTLERYTDTQWGMLDNMYIDVVHCQVSSWSCDQKKQYTVKSC